MERRPKCFLPCFIRAFLWVFFVMLSVSNAADRSSLSDGLVAYYPFNGNANDQSGNGNDGFVVGATLTTDRFESPNSAFSFNGVNNYIACADNNNFDFSATDNFSYGAWIKTNIQPYMVSVILNKAQYDSSLNRQWQLTLNSDGKPYLYLRDGDNIIDSRSQNSQVPNVSDDKWHHLFITIDKSSIDKSSIDKSSIDGAKLYVDGYLQTKQNPDQIGSLENSRSFVIGAWSQDFKLHFQGKIDDVRIYKRALSESEVREIYTSEAESPVPLTPTVQTRAASSVTANSAILNGTVNPNESATTYYFQYGKTTSYGSVTTTADAGSGSTDTTVSASLTGLVANTTYHFRLVARNSNGTTNGDDQTFKTNESAVTEGIDPPDAPVFVDKNNEPDNAPVYVGNIVNTDNEATLSGQMELSVDFPAYNKPVDIWVIVALPDGRFYMADESGSVWSLDKGIFAIAEGVSGKSIKKQILEPFTTGVTGTAFDPWPASGLWWVCWLIAPESGANLMTAISNGKYELGFYIFNVPNDGTPSSGGEVTGPGGSIIHVPTGNSSDLNDITLISGDATDLVNEFQHAVSDVYQIRIANASSVTGDADYTIKIPLTSPVSDPETLALSVKLTSGTVVPVLGEYDQSGNVYRVYPNGLVSGWNMQVVEEPEALIIKGPEAGERTARHSPRWATTKEWNPCDAWVWRLSAPPSPKEAVLDTDLDSLKSAAEDLCRKYSAIGFREPQMWISSLYGGRVVNIGYNTKWGSYYGPSSLDDTPPVDEAELNKLGQIVIDYSQWTNRLFPLYGWSLENIFAHEVFHGVQWGYDIKSCMYKMDGKSYESIQSFTEGTATAIGMTYQEEGDFTGPDLWVRNGSPAPDILNGFGVSGPFNTGYPAQDFFVYVANKYGKNSFTYLVDLFEELANQSKELTPAILKKIAYEEINAVYRKAMDISFKRSLKVDLSEVFTTYALDRAYHMTDTSNLRPTDITLPKNTLRADLFSGGIPGSAYSKAKPFAIQFVWPQTAAPFRIPDIPETNKASGKLPMVFSIGNGGTIGENNIRIFAVPEVGGIAQIEQMFEISKADTTVDIPIAGADSVSILIVSVMTEKHTQTDYPSMKAYINEEETHIEANSVSVSYSGVHNFIDKWDYSQWFETRMDVGHTGYNRDYGWPAGTKLVWNGSSFKMEASSSKSIVAFSDVMGTWVMNLSVEGTMSADSRTIETITCRYHASFQDGSAGGIAVDDEETWEYTVKDIPVSEQNDHLFSMGGTDLQHSIIMDTCRIWNTTKDHGSFMKRGTFVETDWSGTQPGLPVDKKLTPFLSIQFTNY